MAVYRRVLPAFFGLPMCLPGSCVNVFYWGLYTCHVALLVGASLPLYIYMQPAHVCSRDKALYIYRYCVPCFHCKTGKQNQKLFCSKINSQAGKGFQPIFNNLFVCLENSATFVSTKQKEHEKDKDKRKQSKRYKNGLFWRRKHVNRYSRTCIGFSRGAH